LFEFLISGKHLARISGIPEPINGSPLQGMEHWFQGFAAAGYDFATLPVWHLGGMRFKSADREMAASVGMAHGGVITDRKTFESYEWPDPELGRENVEQVRKIIPEGMKLIIFSPDGVLENLTKLMGFEELCFMLEDDPDLVTEIVREIGSRLFRFYEWLLEFDFVGAAFVNDDWGYRTQTFLDHETMRRLIIPWHKKIIQEIHRTGRPALLHSCGQLGELWEDIIEVMKADAKHSYEDQILPVEEAYRKYGNRIAILGGIDVDFICRSEPKAVYARARQLIEQTNGCTGYALGSGNSIPDYVPAETFDALRRAALDG
jgi:uroporphyrinogen decarboxylase